MIARESREACAAVLVDQVFAGRSIFARTGQAFIDICTRTEHNASQKKSVLRIIPLDSQ